MGCLPGELKLCLIISGVHEEATSTGSCGLPRATFLQRLNPRRIVGHYVEFLERVERWLPPEVERVYAIIDNLYIPSSYDVLLFNLAYPRWDFVFQPKYAVYLNLIEPWWKTLRSLALKGRLFEVWTEMVEPVKQATAY